MREKKKREEGEKDLVLLKEEHDSEVGERR